jgi:hypothetical protein
MTRLRNGVGVSISNIPTLSSKRRATAFTPLSLFADGSQGVWYDDSLTSSMYQDSAGTTAAALESPVGKQLDLSGNNNHRTQATSANRPTLSARYNLLTKTEQFDVSPWTVTSSSMTISPTKVTAPDGTLTAQKLIPATSTAIKQIGQSFTGTGVLTSTVYVQANGYNYFSIANNPNNYIHFDLTNGNISTLGTGWASATCVAQGSGWYKITYANSASQSWGIAYYYVDNAFVASGNAAPTSFAGDGTSGVNVWHPDIRFSDQATGLIPTYQSVTSSTVYDTVGFPQYLKYNGSNSSLSTAGINFTATAQMSAFSGVRKFNTTVGCLYESSNNSLGNAGAFAIFVDDPIAAVYEIAAKQSVQYLARTSANFSSPITNTLTQIIDFSVVAASAAATLRVNSALQSMTQTSGGNMGSGNFGNYPLYFGARGGTSLYFNGQEYQTIIVGKTLTATEISNTETYVNSKTKAY